MRKAGDNIPCLPWSLTPRWPHHSVQLRNIDASTSAASRRGAFIDLVAETGTTLRSSEHIHNHPTQGERTRAFVVADMAVSQQKCARPFSISAGSCELL